MGLQRDEQVELLGCPTAAEFLEPLLANLVAGMSAVAEAQRRGKIEIGADGMLHLPAITALPDQSEPVRTRETIYNLIGSVQFPDMLAGGGCRHRVQRSAARPPRAVHRRARCPLRRAAGTRHRCRRQGVASMIPGLEPTQVTVAMRALEGSGRLRAPTSAWPSSRAGSQSRHSGATATRHRPT